MSTVTGCCPLKAPGINLVNDLKAPGINLVNDPFPLTDAEVSVRLDAPPSAVTLLPHGTPLPWTRSVGRLHTTVSIPGGHGMIVIDR
jgi:hypothetical protein